MEKKYKYDAFISYRHTELDKFVAEKLHKQLEAFSLPGSIAKKRKGQKTKIERVFRDKDELPLTSNLEDPIVQALKNSEWLIVICSPRLRESLWCKKEIETFTALRGREHILAVLIEGEPSEAFPDELLYKVEKHTLADGTVEEIRVPVEPLAADVRGRTRKEMQKAMKTENIRLLAAMFELPYDDLRQRHRERRMRRIMSVSLIGGGACLLFGIYSTATALRIQHQKEQIEVQSQQIKEQSEEIMKQSQEILQQNEEIKAQNQELALRQASSLAELAAGYLEAGNRAGAVQTAVEALTESGGIALPYTPQAQYILTESLRAYDTGNIYRAEYQYETAGRIEYVEESPDSDTLVIYDDTQTLTLFDLKGAEVIDIIGSDEYECMGGYGCTFLGEDKFAYINTEEVVCIYDLTEKKVVGQVEPEYASKLSTDAAGRYLAVKQWNDTFMIYDGETLQELGETPEMRMGSFLGGPFIFSEGIFVNAYSMEDENGNKTYTLYFVDMNTMEVISTAFLNHKEPEDVQIQDGIAYMVSGMYDAGYTGCDAYISAIDIASGTLLWEHEQRGHWPKLVDLPMNEGATDLICITSGSFSVRNMQTGELSFTESLASPVVESNVYLNDNNFLLFCQNGEMLVVDKEYGGCFDLSYKFQCKTLMNDFIYHSPYGITAYEHNDNKITVYTLAAGPDVVEIEKVMDYPEEQMLIMGDKACEMARSYGLERPEFVYSLYYSADEKYCFIQYWDNSFIVYDVEAGEIRSTIEEVYPTDWWLGTDEEGYTYLLGYYGCYVLNQDMVPVMWLADARDVDMEARKVYLEWNDHYYEAPLYSVEELLQMAQNYLQN